MPDFCFSQCVGGDKLCVSPKIRLSRCDVFKSKDKSSQECEIEPGTEF